MLVDSPTLLDLLSLTSGDEGARTIQVEYALLSLMRFNFGVDTSMSHRSFTKKFKLLSISVA